VRSFYALDVGLGFVTGVKECQFAGPYASFYALDVGLGFVTGRWLEGLVGYHVSMPSMSGLAL